MSTPLDPYSANAAFPIVPQSPIPGNAIASSSMTINTSQMNFASFTANTGMFGYTGTPQTGQLFFSVAPGGGTDPYGNSYGAGLTVTQGNLYGMTLIGSSLDASSTLNGSTLNQGTVSSSSIAGGTATSTLHIVNSAGGGVYSYAQTTTVVTFTANTNVTAPTNQSWTCPTGVTHGNVQCWAAGGGGDGGQTYQGGSGAGGGEYAQEPNLALTPDQVYTVQVGVGGGGGSTGSGGAAGGNSIFGSNLVVANAGSAGNNGNPGAGGTGSSNSIHSDGGAGGDNFAGNSGGSGGGGGADTGGGGGAGVDGTSSGGAGGSAGGGGTASTGGAGANNGASASNVAGIGGGGGGAGTGTSANTFTNTYYSSRSISYYGSQAGNGKRADSNSGNGTMYQGCASGELSTTGDQYSFAVFDGTQMQLDLSGATINNVHLQLTNLHSWYDSGCYVVMGWATFTSFGSTGSTAGAHENAQSFWIDEGETVNQSVINGWGTVFQNPTYDAQCLMFGPSAATAGGARDLYNYGYFYGSDGSSKSPALTIQYTTSGAGTESAGNGGNGQVQITYTSSANNTINASISPIVTTDNFSNNIPIGVMTSSLQAIQPGSSPATAETWHTLPLVGWTVRSGGYNARYRLTADGCIEIAAEISHAPITNAGPVTIATLPSGYQPAYNLEVPTQAGTAAQGSTAFLRTTGDLALFNLVNTQFVSFSARFPLT